MPTSAQVNIPVFAGQGTAAVNTPQMAQQALRDASSPSGFLLLCACHEALHAELTSLSPDELQQSGLSITDFKTRDALLSPTQIRYSQNPIVSWTRLFLIQSLRYLAFIESLDTSTDPSSSFSAVLACNSEQRVGVLGFSSGILAACVIGVSSSTLTFITWSIEAFRLAFWIGFHSQVHRTIVLQEQGVPNNSPLPWSRVFIGLNKQAAEEAISIFENQNSTCGSLLCVTAVMDDDCVTISGSPEALQSFSDTFRTRLVVHDTTVDALYHSPIHAMTRHKILADVSRRNIRFPDFRDIKTPIRSSFTGQLIDSHFPSGSLVEAVVDMLLVQPVNWNLVITETVKSIQGDLPLRLVNVGPGAGLTRRLEKVFHARNISFLDLTSPDPKVIQPISPVQEPIAIVGMAVNMPGAPNTQKLWELLEKGINTIEEIPEHRFKLEDYHGPKSAKPDRVMKAHTGNFIDGVDEFDNHFFNISPREARNMDPQQRVLLQTAYHALESCGYVPNDTPSFQQQTFGCYIGAATHDYLQNLRDKIDVYYSTGTLKAFLSGRISYALRLGGPSVVVDTACSSSSVAIYQGCRALMNRDCNAALVGGVNVITSPDMFIGLDRAHLLSPVGQCKPFDASADGYARSEGCGIFVLKRLSDAQSENDNILGIIRGIEVNQSGLTHSITHPHFPTQTALFRQLLDRSGMQPSRVNVVEAHGTGTVVGDPIEVASIRSVFGVGRTPSNPLYITSIKGNIGHLEAASGVAGLAKLLLMMENRVIPRQVSFRLLNPVISPLDVDHMVIPTQHVPWTSHGEMSRVALLNNFGAAGSNTALLVEENNSLSHPRATVDHQTTHVFGLSARSEIALEELRSQYLQWLQSPASESVCLVDIAYSMTARRQIHPFRLAVSAGDRSSLIVNLSKAPLVHKSSALSKVVFVFSGQGSQYLGMGQSLYQTSPVFKRHLDHCHRILVSSGFLGVLSIITATPNGDTSSSKERFEEYQTAIVALEYALARLWISWGLDPVAVIGHSLGEYAALVIAGVLTLEDALALVATRARLMVKSCGLGCTGMIAVNAHAAIVENELRSSDNFSGLSVACFNSPVDCVVSGPLDQLQAFKAHLDVDVRCKSVSLSVPFGYHSSAMNPLLNDFTLATQNITLHPPTIPIVSTVLGELVMPGDCSVFTHDYFVRHCSEPVLFDAGIQSLVSRPDFKMVDVWVEIGPQPTSLSMLVSNPAVPDNALLLPSLRKQHEPLFTIMSSLSQLYLSNTSIHWREVFAHLSPVYFPKLPSYPFAKTKFWVPFKEDEPMPVSVVPRSDSTHLITDYSMLRSWVQYPSRSNGQVAIFETPISDLSDSISGHRVGGVPLCPVSVYLEQVFAGLDLAVRHLALPYDSCHAVLRAAEFIKPLVYDERVACVVKTYVTLDDGFGEFSISSLLPSSSEEVLHVHGSFAFRSIFETETKFSRKLSVIARQMSSVTKAKDGEPPEVFSKRTAYEVIFARVVDYAKMYHTIQSITIDSSGMEGYAIVKLPTDHDKGNFFVHPVFMDTLIHVAGLVANLQGGINDVYICNGVASAKVIPSLVDNDAFYGVYCSNAWLQEEGVMLSEAYAVQLTEPRKIVAHLKGMHFRRVRLDSLKRGLSLAIQGMSCRITGTSPQQHLRGLCSQRGSEYPVKHDTSDLVSEVESEVLKVVSENCDLHISALDACTDLATLGIDSFASVKILRKLQATFPDADLSPCFLLRCQSPGDIAREVSSRCSLASSKSTMVSSDNSSPRTFAYDEKLLESNTLNISEEVEAKRILASVLYVNPQDLDDDADIRALGLDSLSSIEALHALKVEFGLDLPRNLFVCCTTIRDVLSYLSNCRQMPAPAEVDSSDVTSSTSQSLQCPIPIQQSKNSNHFPLFLFHDGSGLVNYYDRLPSLNRNVWGIPNPNFMTSQPWDCLFSMAASYAQRVSSISSGPVLLGGWSFGGVIAFETARCLRLNGVDVKGVLLIDSPSPLNHTPLSDTLLDYVVNHNKGYGASDIGKLVKAQFKMNSCLLGNYNPHSSQGPFPPVALLRSKDGFNPPELSDVPLWLANRTDPEQVVAGWENLIGSPIKVWAIPGNHFGPFEESSIAQVSRCIDNACQFLENL